MPLVLALLLSTFGFLSVSFSVCQVWGLVGLFCVGFGVVCCGRLVGLRGGVGEGLFVLFSFLPTTYF